MKVFLDSVGCRLNQSEIETFALQFRSAGHTLVPTADEADLVLVNTCAVTAAAASDSRQKIRQAARRGAAQVIATGCWATLSPASAASLPGVTSVIPNHQKDSLVSDLLQIHPGAFELQLPLRQPVPGSRARTRFFIKVQDGCDNHCTFCVTRLARGSGRSRTIPQVLADVRRALQENPNEGPNPSSLAQEVVLTGVHLGSWGADLSPQLHLSHLVQAILDETGIPRLRLSSLEPWDLDESFFSLWKDARLCRHLHLPLQSGCAATLRRMARKTTPKSFASLVAAARRLIPDVAITTDLIAGFPGEDEAEFAESLAFVREMQFAGGHVFTYSARPGTPASRHPAQVPHPLRQQRNATLRSLLTEASLAFQRSYLGSIMPVLWESVHPLEDQFELSGLTGNYLKVTSTFNQPLWNQVSQVRLTRLAPGGLRGEIES